MKINDMVFPTISIFQDWVNKRNRVIKIDQLNVVGSAFNGLWLVGPAMDNWGRFGPPSPNRDSSI